MIVYVVLQGGGGLDSDIVEIFNSRSAAEKCESNTDDDEEYYRWIEEHEIKGL